MNLETMRLLVAKGLCAADLIEVEEAMGGPADRSAAAVRQANYRARKKADANGITRDVTRDGDSDVTGVIAPSLSRPPNENNSNPPTHTHPENTNTRAREADPFPKPEFASDQLWRDLKANRKLKRLACTPTAHGQLLRDIAKYTDDDWPPGRVLEAAVARGWAAVPADPRETETRQNGQHPSSTRKSVSELGRELAAERRSRDSVAEFVPRLGSAGGYD